MSDEPVNGLVEIREWSLASDAAALNSEDVGRRRNDDDRARVAAGYRAWSLSTTITSEFACTAGASSTDSVRPLVDDDR
jgi:hypothetical protein